MYPNLHKTIMDFYKSIKAKMKQYKYKYNYHYYPMFNVFDPDLELRYHDFDVIQMIYDIP